MLAYDKNKDGRLDSDELFACPAFLTALADFDANQDGGLTADEIAARFRDYIKVQPGLEAWVCTVYLDGQPLAGADVTLVPDPVMGDGFPLVHGRTDAAGVAEPRCDGMPVAGLFCGLYRVEVRREVNGKESLPGRYNSRTELGWEIPPGVLRRGEKIWAIRLTSK